ncbi:hypothetical protein Y032_0167g142 [Ancylostoma ceylanicum]|uniref:Uncharacterized protein n=1 Tax=Ancylostoma ceylanicum TaxID=53326 RepID=A0A016SWV5_9BILA|nr:hypothetical protein Y032_0167g142 [Ancylostoma ceylanicum]
MITISYFTQGNAEIALRDANQSFLISPVLYLGIHASEASIRKSLEVQSQPEGRNGIIFNIYSLRLYQVVKCTKPPNEAH